jgi:hypothetical protein
MLSESLCIDKEDEIELRASNAAGPNNQMIQIAIQGCQNTTTKKCKTPEEIESFMKK